VAACVCCFGTAGADVGVGVIRKRKGTPDWLNELLATGAACVCCFGTAGADVGVGASRKRKGMPD